MPLELLRVSHAPRRAVCGALRWSLALACDRGACSGAAVFMRAPPFVCSQQACEMVMDILRERDQGGFGDRNEYGSRIGGGIDVSAGLLGGWSGRGGSWLVGSRGTADSDKTYAQTPQIKSLLSKSKPSGCFLCVHPTSTGRLLLISQPLRYRKGVCLPGITPFSPMSLSFLSSFPEAFLGFLLSY